MKQLFRYLLCCITLLLPFAFPSYANHVAGGTIRYAHVSDSTYKISVDLYVDCQAEYNAGIPPMGQYRPRILVFDNNTFVDTVSLLPEGAGATETASPCAAASSTQCTNLSSTLPGIRKCTYSATYTFPHQSAAWEFIYNGYNGYANPSSGRSNQITNFLNTLESLRLEADVNSLFSNSTPAINNVIPGYFCINSSCSYNPAASDPDGDSLTFNLISATGPDDITAITNMSVSASYLYPYTFSAPLAAVSFSFSNATGVMSFLPNLQQRAGVVYSIEERRAGVLVGISQTEFTVLVENCTDPCVLATPVISKSSEASIYPNPANDRLTIDAAGSSCNQVIITNAIGTTVLQQPMITGINTLNTSKLIPGVYYVLLKGTAGSNMQKIVVMR